MENLLPGIWSLTPDVLFIGLTALAVISLIRGWIIPKSSHEREMRMANKRGDEWKETALEGRKLASEQSDQISKLVDANKVTAEFFGTVQREGGAQRGPQEKPNSA